MDRLMRHPGLKLASVVLAMLTWFFVRSITNETRTVSNVPLEVKVKPGNTLLQSSVSAVSVVVSGTREDVRQASRADMSVEVDLSREDRTGEWPVRLGTRSIRHPPRVQVVEVQPTTVTVHIDRLIERDLKVSPQIVGELPVGFVIEHTVVRPETVRVRGPALLVDRLTSVESLPIDVMGRRTSFRERVDLAMPDPGITLVQRRWVEADVRIGESRPVDSGRGPGVQGKP